MSDTMCAKTTETSRCQRCGSEFDWLSDGTKIHAGKQYFESDSLLCLERQLNAANQRIKRLEDCAETAWGVIANVDNGSWGEQRADWREAAIRWRDEQFYPELSERKAKEAKP